MHVLFRSASLIMLFHLVIIIIYILKWPVGVYQDLCLNKVVVFISVLASLTVNTFDFVFQAKAVRGSTFCVYSYNNYFTI